MNKLFRSLFRFVAATRKDRARRRQSRSTQLKVEMLETRVMPVVGSLITAQIVLPGSNLDGVVQINSTLIGSGSELANQTEILTAAHVVSTVPQSIVTFNLQRAGNPVNIPITIPANPAGGAATANFLLPTAPLAYIPATQANDIAVINLRDTLTGATTWCGQSAIDSPLQPV